MFFSDNENDYECLLCFSGFFCFFLIWNWCLVWHFCQIGLASHWSFTTYSFIFFWLILSQMLLSKQVKNAIFCQELLPKCALTKKRSYESFCNLPTRKMSLTMNVLQQQPWKPQNKFFLRQSAKNSIIW